MTALAELLIGTNSLTGSDTDEKFYTDEILENLHIPVYEGFQESNIPDNTKLVIYSTAYDVENHVELLSAKKRGIPLLSYPEAVGKLTQEKLTLAVCGTHGKTTTSSLLAETLRSLSDDPTALIGSKISQWQKSSLIGEGRFFVLEADEYQNKLMHYQPYGVILTSLDFDHPDYFEDFDAYRKVFKDFIQRIPKHGVFIFNGDDAEIVKLASEANCQKISYGFIEDNDVCIKNYLPKPITQYGTPGVVQSFHLSHKGEDLGEFNLSLAGRHNTLNATAVIALLLFFGFSVRKAKPGLEAFVGTSRRFEYLGERFGALIYDDYAHHPEELKVTLKAFRELYPDRRMTVLFHPHTFTRTKALFQEFAQAFELADQVLVLPIYGSAREQQGGISSEELVSEINRYQPGKASAVNDYGQITADLEKNLGKNDLIVSLGAGDVWQITHALARKKSS